MATNASDVSLSLNDGVFHRLIQLFQLGIMTGTDVADYMRQVRVRPSAGDPSVLELTPGAEQAFGTTLRQLDERMEQILQEKQATEIAGDHGPKLILAGG